MRPGCEPLVCPVLQSLWVERTTLTLVQSLPGISRWFEVDKRELVSPAGDNAAICFPARNFSSHIPQHLGIDQRRSGPRSGVLGHLFHSLVDPFAFILES